MNQTKIDKRTIRVPPPIGKRFGRWTVTGPATGHGRWTCRCDCGTAKEVLRKCMFSGESLSCGCLKREQSSVRMRQQFTTHGLATRERTHELYFVWSTMKQRCINPNSHKYPDYGGRGIKVCERWLQSFAAFLEDMGERPSPGHSLDRIDPNGNYEPGNVKWSTAKEQANNRRPRQRRAA